MSKVQREKNCLFCNSTQHLWEKCKSINANHWRYVMISETMPDFKSLDTNKLRMIAHVVVSDSRLVDTRRRYGWVTPKSYTTTIGCGGLIEEGRTWEPTKSKRLTRNYKRFLGHNPIPWQNLSRKRLIDAVCERWNSLHPVVEKSKMSPDVEFEACAICYEDMGKVVYSAVDNKWIAKKRNMTTSCKHEFCLSCWDKVRKEYPGFHRTEYKRLCPLCRHPNLDSMCSYNLTCKVIK